MHKKIKYLGFAILTLVFLSSCKDGELTIAESNAVTPSVASYKVDCPVEKNNNGFLKARKYNPDLQKDEPSEYSILALDSNGLNIASKFKYQSDNPAIVVNKEGVIILGKATYSQTAKITVSAVDNVGEKLVKTCDIKVEDMPEAKRIALTNLKITDVKAVELINTTSNKISAEHNVQIGSSEHLRVSIVPADATIKAKWEVLDGGNPGIAFENGLISVAADADLSKNTTVQYTVVNEYKEPEEKVVQITIKPVNDKLVGNLILPSVISGLVDKVSAKCSDNKINVLTLPGTAFNHKLNWEDTNLAGTGLSLKFETTDTEKHEPCLQGTPIKTEPAGTEQEVVLSVETTDGSNIEKQITIKISDYKVPVSEVNITKQPESLIVYSGAENAGFFGEALLKVNSLQLEAKAKAAEAGQQPNNSALYWKSSDKHKAVAIAGGNHGEVANVFAVEESTAPITISACSVSNRDVCASIQINVKPVVKVQSLQALQAQDCNYSEDSNGILTKTNDVCENRGIDNKDNLKFILFDADEYPARFEISTAVLPTDATNQEIEWFVHKPGVLAKQESTDSKIAIFTPKGQGGETKLTIIPKDAKDENGKPANKGKVLTIKTASLALQPIKVGTISSGDYSALSGKKYSIFKTELMYNLWREVYDFATIDNGNGKRRDGGKLYEFKSAGDNGNASGPDSDPANPVTRLSFNDAVAFANALTEYYNYNRECQTNSAVTCLTAYYKNADNSVYRVSKNDISYSLDNTASGFRLPTKAEWEFAASLAPKAEEDVAKANLTSKLGNPAPSFYQSQTVTVNDKDHYLVESSKVSGISFIRLEQIYEKIKTDSGFSSAANKWDYLVEQAPKHLAWYAANAGGKTHSAATKLPNAMGIYDMSGNASEFYEEHIQGGINPNNTHDGKGGRYSHDVAEIYVNSRADLWDAGSSDKTIKNPRYAVGIRFVRNID